MLMCKWRAKSSTKNKYDVYFRHDYVTKTCRSIVELRRALASQTIIHQAPKAVAPKAVAPKAVAPKPAAPKPAAPKPAATKPLVLKPVALKPMAPKPVAPLVLQPMAPLVLQPMAPLVLQPTPPVVLQPTPPVVLQPTTPLVLQPTPPVVLQPTTPQFVVPKPPAPLPMDQVMFLQSPQVPPVPPVPGPPLPTQAERLRQEKKAEAAKKLQLEVTAKQMEQQAHRRRGWATTGRGIEHAMPSWTNSATRKKEQQPDVPRPQLTGSRRSRFTGASR